MLGALGDAERVRVEHRRRLAVVGRDRCEVPVTARIGHAADVPQEVLLHGDLARVEGVATPVEGGALVDRVGHDEVVLEHAVVDPLPSLGPALRDLHGLVVVRGQLAGPEVRSHAAQIVALRLEAILLDLLRVEARLRRVLVGRINGQLHGDLAHGVVVPVDHRAVRHLVLVAVLLRRVIEPGLVEHVRLVVELRGVDGERDADLALARDLVEVDGALPVLGQVVMVLRDEGC